MYFVILLINLISTDILGLSFCCCYCCCHRRHCFCCCLHQHVDSIFSEASRLLLLVQTVTFSFSSLQSPLTLYCTVVRLKLDYASVVWNYITSLDACKLECIQLYFVSLCCLCFFSHLDYSYGNVLNYLKLHTLSFWRHYLDVLFFNQCFQWFKILSCPFGNYWPTCAT